MRKSKPLDAMEQLRRSEATLRSVTDTMESAIIMHRGDRILYVNLAAQRITGYSEVELLAMHYTELAHPTCSAILLERGARRARGEPVRAQFEIRVNTKDGEERWVEVTNGVVDYEGQPTVLGTSVDITERRRADLERRQAQEMLSQIVEGNPVPTFVLNAAHAVTHWNRACELTFGIAAAEMVGTRDAWRAFYSRERPVLADLIVSGVPQQVIEQQYAGKCRRSSLVEDAYEAENFLPQLGAAGCWLLFTAAPLYDAAGQIIGAIETLQDVTERKFAEAALLTAQAELEQLVDKRTTQLAGANAQLEADIERRERTEAEMLARNAERTQLNQRLGQAQEQLLQSEKMASVGQLAAGVAHEINNPIGYVHSNLGSLDKYLGDLFRVLASYEQAEAALAPGHAAVADLRRVKEEVDLAYLKEDVPALMHESKEGITRVRKIVQDLKDFSRVDGNQEWQWCGLHAGLESTINMASNEIKYKADVIRRFGEIPDIECLPSQLNQVFLNLLVNAAHAIEGARGSITVSSGQEGDAVWVAVADTGHGIAEENLKRIFDPFFTTKQIGKGTGLGLSLSYGIVQKHHGRIEVESSVGKGSTFRVLLPIHQPPAQDAAGNLIQ